MKTPWSKLLILSYTVLLTASFCIVSFVCTWHLLGGWFFWTTEHTNDWLVIQLSRQCNIFTICLTKPVMDETLHWSDILKYVTSQSLMCLIDQKIILLANSSMPKLSWLASAVSCSYLRSFTGACVLHCQVILTPTCSESYGEPTA